MHTASRPCALARVGPLVPRNGALLAEPPGAHRASVPPSGHPWNPIPNNKHPITTQSLQQDCCNFIRRPPPKRAHYFSFARPFFPAFQIYFLRPTPSPTTARPGQPTATPSLTPSTTENPRDDDPSDDLGCMAQAQADIGDHLTRPRHPARRPRI